MCDALLVVGSETVDGVTRFAKNSDRKPGEAQPFVQYPAASHPPGAGLRCTHVEIPQVRETYRVMGHTPWWVWGFEHGVNEHGLAVGNLMVFSREPVEETPGLIGMDLVRLALERAAGAREAVGVIAALLERYGQGGAAFAPDAGGYHNAFALADPREAWIVETTGRRFAARRATADALSNHYSIGSDWELASPDLEEHARAGGFWSCGGAAGHAALDGDGDGDRDRGRGRARERGSARLDVSAAFRNPGVPGHISEGRCRRGRELLARACGRIDDAALRAILRDHLADGPGWPGGRTPEDESYFTICAHSPPVHETTASLLARLPAPHADGRGTRRPWPVWISFATPCTGLFLPVYIDGVIPAALTRDGRAGDGGDEPAARSAWRAFKALQDAAAVDPPRYTPLLRSEWDASAGELERERVEVEREAESLAGDGSARGSDSACEALSAFMSRCTDRALEQAATLREQIARDEAPLGAGALRPGAS